VALRGQAMPLSLTLYAFRNQLNCAAYYAYNLESDYCAHESSGHNNFIAAVLPHDFTPFQIS
jgi:hypothetical protein